MSALLVRTMVVGMKQQSKSAEVALDMEQGDLMNRFDIGLNHFSLSIA